MRKLLYLLFIIFFSQCTNNGYMKLQPQYEQEQIGLVPDYSQLVYWAAHPAKKDPSDSLPKPIQKDYQPSDKVDIFFVHPTSYLDSSKPSGWSASLKDAQLNLYTDYTSILNQASIFNQAGKIEYPLSTTDEDGMMEAAIEAGAEDCESDSATDDAWDEYEPVHTVWTARDELGNIAAELEKSFGEAKSVNLVWKAQNEIDNPDQAQSVIRLVDALEDCDDVSTVFHNFELTPAALEKLEE